MSSIIIDLVSSSDDDEGSVDQYSEESENSYESEEESSWEDEVEIIEKPTLGKACPASSSSSSSSSAANSAAIVKKEPVGFGAADIGDDVVELRPEGYQEEMEGTSASLSSNAMDESDLLNCSQAIEFVGGNMMVMADMPHQRETCSTFPFVTGGDISQNLKHCPNCYCYVCDVNVQECLDWELHSAATMGLYSWQRKKAEVQQLIKDVDRRLPGILALEDTSFLLSKRGTATLLKELFALKTSCSQSIVDSLLSRLVDIASIYVDDVISATSSVGLSRGLKVAASLVILISSLVCTHPGDSDCRVLPAVECASIVVMHPESSTELISLTLESCRAMFLHLSVATDRFPTNGLSGLLIPTPSSSSDSSSSLADNKEVFDLTTQCEVTAVPAKQSKYSAGWCSWLFHAGVTVPEWLGEVDRCSDHLIAMCDIFETRCQAVLAKRSGDSSSSSSTSEPTLLLATLLPSHENIILEQLVLPSDNITLKLFALVRLLRSVDNLSRVEQVLIAIGTGWKSGLGPSPKELNQLEQAGGFNRFVKFSEQYQTHSHDDVLPWLVLLKLGLVLELPSAVHHFCVKHICSSKTVQALSVDMGYSVGALSPQDFLNLAPRPLVDSNSMDGWVELYGTPEGGGLASWEADKVQSLVVSLLGSTLPAVRACSGSPIQSSNCTFPYQFKLAETLIVCSANAPGVIVALLTMLHNCCNSAPVDKQLVCGSAARALSVALKLRCAAGKCVRSMRAVPTDLWLQLSHFDANAIFTPAGAALEIASGMYLDGPAVEAAASLYLAELVGGKCDDEGAAVPTCSSVLCMIVKSLICALHGLGHGPGSSTCSRVSQLRGLFSRNGLVEMMEIIHRATWAALNSGSSASVKKEDLRRTVSVDNLHIMQPMAPFLGETYCMLSVLCAKTYGYRLGRCALVPTIDLMKAFVYSRNTASTGIMNSSASALWGFWRPLLHSLHPVADVVTERAKLARDGELLAYAADVDNPYSLNILYETQFGIFPHIAGAPSSQKAAPLFLDSLRCCNIAVLSQIPSGVGVIASALGKFSAMNLLNEPEITRQLISLIDAKHAVLSLLMCCAPLSLCNLCHCLLLPELVVFVIAYFHSVTSEIKAADPGSGAAGAPRRRSWRSFDICVPYKKVEGDSQRVLLEEHRGLFESFRSSLVKLVMGRFNQRSSLVTKHRGEDFLLPLLVIIGLIGTKLQIRSVFRGFSEMPVASLVESSQAVRYVPSNPYGNQNILKDVIGSAPLLFAMEAMLNGLFCCGKSADVEATCTLVVIFLPYLEHAMMVKKTSALDAFLDKLLDYFGSFVGAMDAVSAGEIISEPPIRCDSDSDSASVVRGSIVALVVLELQMLKDLSANSIIKLLDELLGVAGCEVGNVGTGSVLALCRKDEATAMFRRVLEWVGGVYTKCRAGGRGPTGFQREQLIPSCDILKVLLEYHQHIPDTIDAQVDSLLQDLSLSPRSPLQLVEVVKTCIELSAVGKYCHYRDKLLRTSVSILLLSDCSPVLAPPLINCSPADHYKPDPGPTVSCVVVGEGGTPAPVPVGRWSLRASVSKALLQTTLLDLQQQRSDKLRQSQQQNQNAALFYGGDDGADDILLVRLFGLQELLQSMLVMDKPLSSDEAARAVLTLLSSEELLTLVYFLLYPSLASYRYITGISNSVSGTIFGASGSGNINDSVDIDHSAVKLLRLVSSLLFHQACTTGPSPRFHSIVWDPEDVQLFLFVALTDVGAVIDIEAVFGRLTSECWACPGIIRSVLQGIEENLQLGHVILSVGDKARDSDNVSVTIQNVMASLDNGENRARTVLEMNRSSSFATIASLSAAELLALITTGNSFVSVLGKFLCTTFGITTSFLEFYSPCSADGMGPDNQSSQQEQRVYCGYCMDQHLSFSRVTAALMCGIDPTAISSIVGASEAGCNFAIIEAYLNAVTTFTPDALCRFVGLAAEESSQWFCPARNILLAIAVERYSFPERKIAMFEGLMHLLAHTSLAHSRIGANEDTSPYLQMVAQYRAKLPDVLNFCSIIDTTVPTSNDFSLCSFRYEIITDGVLQCLDKCRRYEVLIPERLQRIVKFVLDVGVSGDGALCQCAYGVTKMLTANLFRYLTTDYARCQRMVEGRGYASGSVMSELVRLYQNEVEKGSVESMSRRTTIHAALRPYYESLESMTAACSPCNQNSSDPSPSPATSIMFSSLGFPLPATGSDSERALPWLCATKTSIDIGFFNEWSKAMMQQCCFAFAHDQSEEFCHVILQFLHDLMGPLLCASARNWQLDGPVRVQLGFIEEFILFCCSVARAPMARWYITGIYIQIDSWHTVRARDVECRLSDLGAFAKCKLPDSSTSTTVNGSVADVCVTTILCPRPVQKPDLVSPFDIAPFGYCYTHVMDAVLAEIFDVGDSTGSGQPMLLVHSVASIQLFLARWMRQITTCIVEEVAPIKQSLEFVKRYYTREMNTSLSTVCSIQSGSCPINNTHTARASIAVYTIEILFGFAEERYCASVRQLALWGTGSGGSVAVAGRVTTLAAQLLGMFKALISLINGGFVVVSHDSDDKCTPYQAAVMANLKGLSTRLRLSLHSISYRLLSAWKLPEHLRGFGESLKKYSLAIDGDSPPTSSIGTTAPPCVPFPVIPVVAPARDLKMGKPPFSDLKLLCGDCLEMFDFTVADQWYYLTHYFQYKPSRCKACKDIASIMEAGNDRNRNTALPGSSSGMGAEHTSTGTASGTRTRASSSSAAQASSSGRRGRATRASRRRQRDEGQSSGAQVDRDFPDMGHIGANDNAVVDNTDYRSRSTSSSTTTRTSRPSKRRRKGRK